MGTLSVCIIAKNEEKIIGRCLESIQSIADEVIVVDTGSTDQTLTIAKKYNAISLEMLWENDFSKARNLGLEKATKDWILILDCDEYLEETECEKLKILLNTPSDLEAYHFRILNYIGGRVSSTAMVLRLFRNRKEYRFEGKIHEQIINSIARLSGTKCLKEIDISIKHDGYDNALYSQKDKSKRNLDLLLSYEESKRDGYYYYSLGNEYARIKELHKAIACYRRVTYKLEYVLDRPVYYAYLMMHLVSVYHELNYYDEVIKACDEAEKYLPGFKDLYFSKALAYRNTGQLALAKIYTQRYLGIQEINFAYPTQQYREEDIYTVLKEIEPIIIEPCLNTCIVVTKDTPNLRDAIRNMYNVSQRVFLIMSSTRRRELGKLSEELTHLGAEVIWIEDECMDGFTMKLPSRVRGEWLLVLKDDELVSFSIVNLFPSLVQNPVAMGYKLATVDWQTGGTTKELRLVKLTDEGDIAIPSNKILECCIVIYKHYKVKV